MPKMPDFTPAAAVACVQAVLGVALAFGLNLDPGQQAALLGLVAALAALLLGHDAVVRGNRAKHLVGPLVDARAADAIRAAAASVTTPPPAPDPIRAATERAKVEAVAEQAAHDANAAAEPESEPGVDPATLPPQ